MPILHFDDGSAHAVIHDYSDKTGDDFPTILDQRFSAEEWTALKAEANGLRVSVFKLLEQKAKAVDFNTPIVTNQPTQLFQK